MESFFIKNTTECYHLLYKLSTLCQLLDMNEASSHNADSFFIIINRCLYVAWILKL